MLQLIGCVNEGREFLGLSTQQVGTLLIEQDEGRSLLRSHIERMLPCCPSLESLIVPKVLVLWDNTLRDFEAKGSLLEELIFLSSASIVIIDSVTSLGIEDINQPSTATLFDKLRVIAGKYHCSFVLLHHPNKSGDVMASNLIKAKVDCLLHLEHDRLVFEKLRGTTPKVVAVKPGDAPHISISKDPDTLTFTQAKDRTTLIRELLLEGKTRSEVIDLVCQVSDAKKETIGKAVDRERSKLIQEGKLISSRP